MGVRVPPGARTNKTASKQLDYSSDWTRSCSFVPVGGTSEPGGPRPRSPSRRSRVTCTGVVLRRGGGSGGASSPSRGTIWGPKVRLSNLQASYDVCTPEYSHQCSGGLQAQLASDDSWVNVSWDDNFWQHTAPYSAHLSNGHLSISEVKAVRAFLSGHSGDVQPIWSGTIEPAADGPSMAGWFWLGQDGAER